MEKRIDILGLHLDSLYAKNALRTLVECVNEDAMSVIEIITMEQLIQLEEFSHIKKEMNMFDLLLPGDEGILKCIRENDAGIIKEIREKKTIRLFLQYLHKAKKRVYFLVETEEDGGRFYAALQNRYSGIQLGGMAKVSAENRADDMLINAINGADIDCIISVLPFPLQEDFVIANRNLLNSRVWLGFGNDFFTHMNRRLLRKKWSDFFAGIVLKREVKKYMKKK